MISSNSSPMVKEDELLIEAVPQQTSLDSNRRVLASASSLTEKQANPEVEGANKAKQQLPIWNNPILYLINIHILIALHAFSWWALLQTVDHPLRKHIISQPLSFIQKTITNIPEAMYPMNNHNISVIISEYFPSDDTVISTSFLAGPLFGFVVMPIADYILPFNENKYVYHNEMVDKKDIDHQTRDYSTFFRVIPLIFTVSMSALFWYSLSCVHLLTFEQLLMHSLSLGVAIAQSGAISHELLHKRTWLEKVFSRILLSYHCYLHFPLEHVYSHHKKAATPQDAATSRYGENVYSFVVRSFTSGYMNAWEIDAQQRQRLKKGTIPSILKSEMVWNTVATIVLPLFIAYKFGALALTSFIITSLIASSLIECTNYVEHFGLLRRLMDNGEYEPVNETHSYDAVFRFSSYSYFNILFHADHHFYPTRNYYKLRIFEKSPKLPYGYSTMILLAFVPPLYFNTMNPILLNFYEERGIDYEKLLNQE